MCTTMVPVRSVKLSQYLLNHEGHNERRGRLMYHQLFTRARNSYQKRKYFFRSKNKANRSF